MSSIEIITNVWPVRDVLPLLLTDRSSKKNIIFATESYADRGEGYEAKNQITEQVLNTAEGCVIQPRVLKNSEEQLLRTRRKAEVFTPAWVCCLMNNHIDEVWFGRPDVFGKFDGQNWTPSEAPIQLPKRKRWQTYVDSRRLEITCGEAPYLVSRYDMATGEIIPIENRIGILDRKLRIINENTTTEKEWLKWTVRAFQSVYGYEYQGDNLLIARINLLMTYIDFMDDHWNRKPTSKELAEIARIISWNIWQMDGLKGSIPLGALYEEYHQLTIFDIFGMDDGNGNENSEECVASRVFDWRGRNQSLEFNAFRERRNGSMKFDFIIGNPPYNEDFNNSGDNKTFAAPIYNKFIDAAYDISDRVELIHPARFLSNAGSTPKAWNKKMLKDPHLKIVHYESDARKIFTNTDIKGGIAITYHDKSQSFGAIEVFTQFDELNSILHSVKNIGFVSISTILVSGYAYHFTQSLYDEHPEFEGLMSKGHKYDLKSNVFDTMFGAFSKEKRGDNYIGILGRKDNNRVTLYINRRYINHVVNLDKYKVFIPRGSGRGDFGEAIALPIVGIPGEGATETFLSIGSFDTITEANYTIKYIKTKFVRALMSILKTTQIITPGIWKYVPLQDFTSASDIDWSKPIAGIDRQLYAKYSLSEEEIAFIETHVKEME